MDWSYDDSDKALRDAAEKKLDDKQKKGLYEDAKQAGDRGTRAHNALKYNGLASPLDKTF